MTEEQTVSTVTLEMVEDAIEALRKEIYDAITRMAAGESVSRESDAE